MSKQTDREFAAIGFYKKRFHRKVSFSQIEHEPEVQAFLAGYDERTPDQEMLEELKFALKYLDSFGRLEESDPDYQMRESFRKVIAKTEGRE